MTSPRDREEAISGEPKDGDGHLPPFWCETCGIDLQSNATLEEHKQGRRHTKRQNRSGHGERDQSVQKRPPSDSMLPPLEEDELFESLALGHFRNVVVLTGAGVSTAAGVPDFRSPGGLFDVLRDMFSTRFPSVCESPESILSRDFAVRYSDVYEGEVLPLLKHVATSSDAYPTDTHRFCAWLSRQGWLRRIYTQNVDGLHLHPDLEMADERVVVECHGAARDGSMVLYGDDLPRRFFHCCDEDFPCNPQIGGSITSSCSPHPVDLILVFGTSLQVAPFCAVPNLAPRGCARVLVNRRIDECIRNKFDGTGSRDHGMLPGPRSTTIGSRKHVSLRPLWTGREGRKRWRQLLVEGDCDEFVQRFFSSPAARKANLTL